MEHLTIGRLAALAEVNVETVRYYQRRGLIFEPPRKHGEIRRYGSDDVERLRFIRRAQDMGFALREIDHLLHLKSHGQCQETRAIVSERLSTVEQQIAVLSGHRAELKAWIAACDRSTPDSACPRLESLRSELTHCDSC